MQALLEHFITQSTVYSLLAVMLVAFLESLALVGLILPGTVMMAGLGALIGGGEVNFWQAWLAGIVGCLLGDWISFWLGWRFKKPLHRWSFMKKNRALLEKTEHALHQHSMITILIGRFVGPTRPLVPMVAGMLDLPVAKFVLPNIIGCLLWPPLYFLPGILAGAAIDIPADGSGQLQSHAHTQDHRHTYSCTYAKDHAVHYGILVLFIRTHEYHADDFRRVVLIDRHKISVIHDSVQRYRTAEILFSVL